MKLIYGLQEYALDINALTQTAAHATSKKTCLLLLMSIKPWPKPKSESR